MLATTGNTFKQVQSVAQVADERPGAEGPDVDDNATTPRNVVDPPSAGGSIATQCNEGGGGTKAAPGCRCRYP